MKNYKPDFENLQAPSFEEAIKRISRGAIEIEHKTIPQTEGICDLCEERKVIRNHNGNYFCYDCMIDTIEEEFKEEETSYHFGGF